MADSPEEIKKAVKTYLLVFLILCIFTILTVAVATVEFLDIGKHGFDAWDCALGLAIATAKASLVAAIFMHLNHEKKTVYWIFALAGFMGIILFGVSLWADEDPIFDKFFYSASEQPALETADAAE